MLTSKECFAKAVDFDRLSLESRTPLGRGEYACLAHEWRCIARLAGQHEAWAAEHPAWRLDIEHLTKGELLEMRAELQRLLDKSGNVRSHDARGLIVRADTPQRIARMHERITQLNLMIAEHEAGVTGSGGRRSPPAKPPGPEESPQAQLLPPE
jgi:hypothetical protein